MKHDFTLIDELLQIDPSILQIFTNDEKLVLVFIGIPFCSTSFRAGTGGGHVQPGCQKTAAVAANSLPANALVEKRHVRAQTRKYKPDAQASELRAQVVHSLALRTCIGSQNGAVQLEMVFVSRSVAIAEPQQRKSEFAAQIKSKNPTERLAQPRCEKAGFHPMLSFFGFAKKLFCTGKTIAFIALEGRRQLRLFRPAFPVFFVLVQFAKGCHLFLSLFL